MTTTCAQVREMAAAYVLDALEDGEREAVEAHLAGCTETHAELRELAAVVPALNKTITPVEPPPALRARLLAAATADLQARSAKPAATKAAPSVRVAPPIVHRPVFAWAATFAALALVVVLGGATFVLQANLNAAQRYEQGVAAVLDLAAKDGSQFALLQGETPSQISGIAALGRDGRVAVALRNLPATTGNEVYQAWVISGDSAPVAVAGFRVNADGRGSVVGHVPAAGPAATIAVTLEPAPGATVPGGPIVAAGSGNATGG